MNASDQVPPALTSAVRGGDLTGAVAQCIRHSNEGLWAWLVLEIGENDLAGLLRDEVLLEMEVGALHTMLAGLVRGWAYALVAEIALCLFSDPDTHFHRLPEMAKLAVVSTQLTNRFDISTFDRLQSAREARSALRSAWRSYLRKWRFPPITGNTKTDTNYFAQCAALLSSAESTFDEALFMLLCCCALGDVHPHPMVALTSAIKDPTDEWHTFLREKFLHSEVGTARRMQDGTPCIVVEHVGELYLLRVQSGPVFEMLPFDEYERRLCVGADGNESVMMKIRQMPRERFFDTLPGNPDDYKAVVMEEQRYGRYQSPEFLFQQNGEVFNFRCPPEVLTPAYPSYISLFINCCWKDWPQPDQLTSLTDCQARWVSNNGFLQD
eukprot:TRINITY_DN75010_c0_g1_i1.p1 TRINITY_DN75010_c0_g1~~TRINITY_DN75010_c0_g1_i1.p1  ORF type:complete len:381 (+),score=106.23 TRINITY_DN75010_c0_g1_i1:140-1282(+)